MTNMRFVTKITMRLFFVIFKIYGVFLLFEKWDNKYLKSTCSSRNFSFLAFLSVTHLPNLDSLSKNSFFFSSMCLQLAVATTIRLPNKGIFRKLDLSVNIRDEEKKPLVDTRSQVQCTTRQKADPSVSKSTNVVVLISPVTKEMIY